MPKLNQIIAIEKGVKQTSKTKFADIYQEVQKAPLLNGVSRTYQPKDDEGDQLPPESTLVQVSVTEKLTEAKDALERLFDVTLTKEAANQSAKADVVVDGTTILANQPVTYLLFLERELVDIKTFIKSLPVLDPAFNWTLNEQTGVYEAEPVGTVKTKKVPRNWVKAEATDKHPAQVEIFHEDVVVGTWTTVRTSGAIPIAYKVELLERVTKLQDAVTFARESANNADVENFQAGANVFSYLFG